MKHSPSQALNVSRETTERLATYAALLLRWNARINLVSKQTEADLWRRHFVDSLQLVTFLPGENNQAVDLGSGAGFPGLVLSIATGCHFHLIEADVRKAAFLREVAAATGASVTVHAARLDDVVLPLVRVVTARALADLPRLLPSVKRFLADDGVALLLKGRRIDEELTACSPQWHMNVERYESVTDPDGVILRLTEVQRV